MQPAVTPTDAALPTDQVRVALENPDVRNGLRDHVRAGLGLRLADRPAAVLAEEIDEAVQETELRALRDRHKYDPKLGEVGAWLHGIMNNVLAERVRSLHRQPVQAPDDPAAWERLAADLARQAAEAVSDRLTAADYLARLPPEHREILQLRFYDDQSHKEIAAGLGISPGNARVRLCRALIAAQKLAGVNPGEERP